MPEAASSQAPDRPPAAVGMDAATELQQPAPSHVPHYPDLEKHSAAEFSKKWDYNCMYLWVGLFSQQEEFGFRPQRSRSVEQFKAVKGRGAQGVQVQFCLMDRGRKSPQAQVTPTLAKPRCKNKQDKT